MTFSISRLACAVFVAGVVFPCSLMAQVFNMEGGQSRVLQTKQKIDTIFISSPEVADYEIVDDNSFILYAKSEGVTEVTVFDSNGKTLRNDTVNVNAMMKGIDRANQEIKLTFPHSNLSVKRVGKAYVIEGKAKSELERQEVTRIIGAALGASEEVRRKTIQLDGVTPEELPFLDEYRYREVVDTSTMDSNTQINVRLSVVEVSQSLTQQLGIKWNNLPRSVSSMVIPGSIHRDVSFRDGTVAGNGFAIGFGVDQINGFIQALEDDGKARVLSEPNISMLSGEYGSILVGGEVPFIQRDSNGSSVYYKEFGVKLAVAAKLLKDDRIRMFLYQEVSDIASIKRTEEGDSVPTIATRKSRSTFEIPDGGSFVLGGLYSNNDSNTVSKLPLLGDIPILGAFFRNVNKSKEKRELIVVATVNLVKPSDTKDITYPYYQETGLLEEYFNIPNIYHRTLTDNFFKRAGFSQ